LVVFFFSSRRRHTRSKRDWSSDVCSSDLAAAQSVGVAESVSWFVPPSYARRRCGSGKVSVPYLAEIVNRDFLSDPENHWDKEAHEKASRQRVDLRRLEGARNAGRRKDRSK